MAIWDVMRPKYFTIYDCRSLQGNLKICQGILRENFCARVWEPCSGYACAQPMREGVTLFLNDPK